MIIQFLRTHIQPIVAMSGLLSGIMVCDFLLLVTSLGFHWWQPVWKLAISRAMLICLVVLSTTYGLLSIFRIWTNVKSYRRSGYDLVLARRLIASIETFALMILCAAWGLLALASQPAILPLKLLGIVWIGGFIGFFVLRVYDLRCKRRRS